MNSESRVLTPSWLIGAGFLLLALILAMVLSSPETPPQDGSLAMPNPLGPVGDAIRFALVGAFGIGSFMLCFQLVWIGSTFLSGQPIRSLGARLFGGVVAMFAAGALVQAMYHEKAFPGGPFPLGGLFGDFTQGKMEASFGLLPTLTALALGTMAAMILATDRLLPDFMIRILAPGGVATTTRKTPSRTTLKKGGGLIEAPLLVPGQSRDNILPPLKGGGLIEAAPHRSARADHATLPPLKGGGLIEARVSNRPW